jgi:hypothetical protein
MWLDSKYIGMVSPRLERFKNVNSKLYNCRCPFCGDSQKNKSKARGFFFEKSDGSYLYHCHNCNITLGLDKFLETVDNNLHKEYILEKISINKPVRIKTDVEVFSDKMKQPVFIKTTQLKNLKKISQLEWNHPAKQYIMSRLIPSHYHSKLFYAPKFKSFVNSIIPKKFESDKNDEPRLIIPFLDEDKNLFALQGRAFGNNSIRYITIIFDNSKPKIFNLDSCDMTKTHYIFEGPIDAMFAKNSLAMAGSSVGEKYLNKNSVLVYDNEPRSKEICAKIQKAIESNHKVLIWPEYIKSKDLNMMIMKNEITDVESLLVDNTFCGLEAKLHYTAWKRI